MALATGLYRMRSARFRGIQPAWMRMGNAFPAIRRERGSVRVLSMDQLLITSLPYQLHYQYRNSMMHGIESRLPFLDPDLVATCLAMPADIKIHHGKRTAVLRWGLHEYLPGRLLKSTQKHAFEPPEREWMLKHQDRFAGYLDMAVNYFPDLFTPELKPAFIEACRHPDANLRVFFRISSLVVWVEAFGIAGAK